jgi:hypothetical protein
MTVGSAEEFAFAESPRAVAAGLALFPLASCSVLIATRETGGKEASRTADNAPDDGDGAFGGWKAPRAYDIDEQGNQLLDDSARLYASVCVFLSKGYLCVFDSFLILFSLQFLHFFFSSSLFSNLFSFFLLSFY